MVNGPDLGSFLYMRVYMRVCICGFQVSWVFHIRPGLWNGTQIPFSPSWSFLIGFPVI